MQYLPVVCNSQHPHCLEVLASLFSDVYKGLDDVLMYHKLLAGFCTLTTRDEAPRRLGVDLPSTARPARDTNLLACEAITSRF